MVRNTADAYSIAATAQHAAPRHSHNTLKLGHTLAGATTHTRMWTRAALTERQSR